ncbi:M3K5 kinase, partial [Polypterus senegalus]
MDAFDYASLPRQPVDTSNSAAAGSLWQDSLAIAFSSTSKNPLSPKSRGRALTVVYILTEDGVTPEKQEDIASLKCLKEACAAVHAEWKAIPFESLALGTTEVLDCFYNADVAVVEMSDSFCQPSIFYHLGVRESFQMTNNILLYCYEKDSVKEQCGTYTFIPYIISHQGKVLACEAGMVKCLPDLCQPGFNLDPLFTSLSERLIKHLGDVHIHSCEYFREMIRNDIRSARERYSGVELSRELAKIQQRLDTVELLSPDIVMNLLLSYRDVQDYDAIINLVEMLQDLPTCDVAEQHNVKFQYAFALNRRNQSGDRMRALNVILSVVENGERIASDLYCLCGRIYKDMFISSGFTDYESRDKACHWYATAFESEPTLHSGINTAVLLIAAGHQFETSARLRKIGVRLSSLLGRKGSLEKMEFYWDVGFYLGASILSNDHSKAIQASEKLYRLKVPVWYLASLTETYYLYKQFAKVPQDNFSKQDLFEFWMNLLFETCKPTLTEKPWPILILEPTKIFQPSYLSVSNEDKEIGTVKLWHISSQDKYDYEYTDSGDKVVLGKGTYGVVYAGRDLSKQVRIAIKEIPEKDSRYSQILHEEIVLHKRLKHRNIVQYLGSISQDGFIKIFMEEVPGGSLSSLLRAKWGPLKDNEATIIYYTKQILEGLKYLHDNQIVHRDIKGDNVLINTYSGLLKISDFGTSKRLAGINPCTETFTGTLQYMAPEIIDKGPRGYGKPADIWSLGCTIIEMATGKPPFFELGSPQAAMFKVGMFKIHPPVPECMSEEAKAFILKCFEPDPDRRTTATDLLQDSFLKTVSRKKNKGVTQTTLNEKIAGDYQRSLSVPTRTMVQNAHLVNETSSFDNKKVALNWSRCETNPSINENNLSPSFLSVPDEPLYDTSSPAAPEENLGMFILRKDSERRATLHKILSEDSRTVIQHMLESQVQGGEEPGFTAEHISQLLSGLKEYIRNSDQKALTGTLQKLNQKLFMDGIPVSSLQVVLFSFQDAVKKVLKQQNIKPHWMFALDNLLRKAVQVAIAVLLPELKLHLQSSFETDDQETVDQNEDVKEKAIVSPSPIEDGQDSTLRYELNGDTVGTCTLQSASVNVNPLVLQLNGLRAETVKLLAQLTEKEREYQDLLRKMVKRKDEEIDHLQRQKSSAPIALTSTYVFQLLAHEFTLQSLLFVATKDDLKYCGIRLYYSYIALIAVNRHPAIAIKSKTLLQKWENGRDKEQKATELERDKKSEKASPSQRMAAYSSLKSEYCSKSEKGKYKQGNEFEKSSAAGFLEGSQTGSPDPSGEQEKRYKVRNQKEREYEDEPKYTSKITVNTIKDHDIFDERWDELDYFPSSEEFRKDDDDDDYDVEDDLYRNRKDNRVTASAPAEVAAPSKKAEPSAYRSVSPNEGPKSSRYKEKPGLSPPPPPPPSPPPVKKTSENREREKNVARKQDSPTETGPSSSGYREAEVNFKVNTFLEEYPSGSGVISSERLISRDLVHPSKKDQEFRSIFQHIETSQSRRSPSEVFAQHIVNIVHHVKARHFETSRMTLNERFGMYQRRAADKETSKQKKSPEIHRRIDVSPSAFMKHSHHYEEVKSSREDSYKEEGKKNKGNTVDLRLDIERRKKYPSKEQDSKREGLRDSEESHESSISRERSSEKPKKSHKASKKPKKHKKTRERSRSSSTSSSSSHSYKGGDFPEEFKEKQEVFDKSRLGSRDYSGAERGRSRGGFVRKQFRIRGGSWNRGNNSENSNGNSTNVVAIKRSKEEEWDPEYTPKSKKYYLHDNREGEGEKKWLENRGRGRGTFQRGRGRFMFKKSGSTTSPKWAHDMFQGSGEEGELHDEDSDEIPTELRGDHKKQPRSMRKDLEPTESISISINEQHGLKVNWASPKSFPVTGYVIEWWIMSKKFPATNNFKLVGPNVTELDITGNLEPFKLYRVAVYPQYIEGYGCPQFVDAYFKQRAPSIAPALKVGEIGKSHAELIWEEIPLDDRNGFIQTYTIFYRAENGKWSHVNVDGSKRSLILKNLNSSSVYQVFIMASTVEGSINGTIKSINTNILDHGSILITIIPVCIAVVLLLIIAASACLINHRQLKLSFWPTVPDPANSNISKWTPTEERVDTNQTKLQDNNSMNLSKLSFLDVSTKATEGIVQDRPLQSESHGCGQDEMIMNNAFKVTSLDSDNNSGVIQYATVIFSGYKGQNAFQPSYMRSDSTQPLLQDVPTSPNHYENMWFHDTREVSAFTTCTDERNSLTDPELTWEDFPLLRGLTTKEYGQESIC